MPPGRGGKRPSRTTGKLAEVAPPVNYDNETPKFCLRHLQAEFDVHALDTNGQAAFALALQKRSRMTWREITVAPKHGLGLEMMPVSSLRPNPPAAFEGQERVMVLRYNGKLPMAGVRVRDVLHLLWIEPNYGDLYDHGS